MVGDLTCVPAMMQAPRKMLSIDIRAIRMVTRIVTKRVGGAASMRSSQISGRNEVVLFA